MGLNLGKLRDAERGRLRNRCLGFVYRFTTCCRSSVRSRTWRCPLAISGACRRKPRMQAGRCSKRSAGASSRSRSGELSGGERQRPRSHVLVTQPACVLADEPTGNLDRRTAEVVFDLMLSLNQRLKTVSSS